MLIASLEVLKAGILETSTGKFVTPASCQSSAPSYSAILRNNIKPAFLLLPKNQKQNNSEMKCALLNNIDPLRFKEKEV